MARPLRLVVLVIVAVGCAACGRLQARTPPPVAMHVPPPPARGVIPVTLPEQPVVEPEPEPPPAPPATPPRTKPETPPRTVIERPPTPAPTAPADAPTPVLQTTTNVGALEQRASWLLGEAERNLKGVNPAQLVPQERAQYDTAISFIQSAKRAIQNRNFNYAEQLADKAAKLARALVKA